MNTQHEQLLITWAEKASGYAWLHQRSIKVFKRRNLYLSVPASVFGYVAGVCVLLSNDVFNDCSHIFNKSWLRAIVGIIALLAGLFSNFQEIYSFKEEGEKHRIAHQRFMAFFREISCAVTMAPKNKITTNDYITMKRLEFDKILEQSPDIPQSIITLFNNTFKDITIHKPDATVGLQTIIPYQENSVHYNMRDKKLLSQYFNIWRKQSSTNTCIDHTLLEVTNSNDSNVSIELANSSRFCSHKNKSYILMHGLLSEQKRILGGHNIKIKRNPMDLEKGEK